MGRPRPHGAHTAAMSAGGGKGCSTPTKVNTDTKSAIGGTRVSEAATPAVAAGNRVFTTRIVGGAGVALAASVILQNAMFVGGVARLLGLGDGTAAPTYGDPLGVVLAYHAANRSAV